MNPSMRAKDLVGGRPAWPRRLSPWLPASAQGLDRRVGHAFTLAFVVALMLALPTLSMHWTGAGWPLPARSAPPSAVSPDALVSNGNVSYCGLLGENPGAVADQPNFTANVTALWFELCNSSAFITVINEWGNFKFVSPGSGSNISYWTAANLSVQTGGVIGQVPSVFFVVSWGSLCDNLTLGPAASECSFEEYWTGNLSTDQLSGPISSERVGIGAGPGASSQVNSPLWSNGFIVAVGLGITVVLGISVVLARKRPPQQSGPESCANDAETPLARPTSSADSKTDGPDPLEDVF
jgi:hypothetical protein